MKTIFLFVWILLVANYSKAQWEPDVRLTNAPDTSMTFYGMSHQIAASGDTVNIVWKDRRNGNMDIYYNRSTDAGVTWNLETQLTTDPARQSNPCIAISGSFVHIVWQDIRDGNYEIYYKRSTDGGISWGQDTRLTNDSYDSYEPVVAVSGSTVHVAWTDWNTANNHWEIHYKNSTDGGVTWGTETFLTNNSIKAFNPSIAVSAQVVHLIWNDNRDGDLEIYYKQSSDGGTTWGQDKRLTNAAGNSNLCSIAVNGSMVHVAWDDDRDGNKEIYYKRSTDGGINWEPDTRLTNDPAISQSPNIVAAGSMVHIVWQDTREGLYAVYYLFSTDEGANWDLGSEYLLNDILYFSEQPSIAVSGPVLHVVWTDYRDYDYEIYYKRNPTGGFPVGIRQDPKNLIGEQIMVFPNPASNSIHLSFNNYSGLLAGMASDKTFLTVRNILGYELLSSPIQSGETIIDVSGLQNGFYFVNVKTNKHQVSGTKLIISK